MTIAAVKTSVVAMLERIIVDCRDAIEAVEDERADDAIEKFESISSRLASKAKELRLR